MYSQWLSDNGHIDFLLVGMGCGILGRSWVAVICQMRGSRFSMPLKIASRSVPAVEPDPALKPALKVS